METAVNDVRKWGQTVTFDVVTGSGIGNNGNGDDELCRLVGDSEICAKCSPLSVFIKFYF